MDKLKPQGRVHDFPDLEMPAAPPRARPPVAPQKPPLDQSARRPAAAMEAGSLPPAPGPAPFAEPRAASSASPQDYFGGSTFDADHFGPSLAGIETDPDGNPGKSADVQSYFGGSTFDADFDDAHPAELDQDFGPAPGPAGVNVEARSSPHAASRPPAQAPGHPAASALEIPSATTHGRPPEREALRIDELEIRTLADYGPVPSSLFLTPLYTFRVASRQRALRTALRGIDSKLRQAERQRDELLAQLFSRVRPVVESDSRFAGLLAPVRELDQLANQRSQELSRSSGEYQERVAALDGQIVALNTGVAQHTELLKQQNLEHEKHDEAFRRAEARSKRLYIEIRSAMQLAAQAAQAAGLPPGTAPPEHAAKIQAFEQQALAMRPVLDELRLPLEAAKSALSATKAQIETHQRAIFRVEEQKRAVAQQFGRQLEERAAGLGQAEDKLGQALAEAGRAVLGAQLPAALEDPSVGAIRQADEGVLGLTKESERYLRALDVYDRQAVKQGFIVLGVALAIVLVSIALLIVL